MLRRYTAAVLTLFLSASALAFAPEAEAQRHRRSRWRAHERRPHPSISLRLGFFAPRIESELWDENLGTFALERSDFDALVGGVELAVPLARQVDVTFGVQSASRSAESFYLDFVRDDDTEIIQDIRFRDTPATVGIRFVPVRGLSPVSPYVTAGVAVHFYEYREEGEFIDFDTFDIFVDQFTDRGVALGTFLGGGVEVALARQILLFGEYRHHWAGGEHGDDFEGFGSFELRARELMGGVSLRF